ncbi:MAG: peptidoglycan DD-metalloendopeptidase family protein [Thermoanaerobaculia bacterium]
MRSGQTLGQVFADLGMGGSDAQAALDQMRPYVDPRRLKPGDVYTATFDSKAALASFELQLEGRGKILLANTEGRWQPTWDPAERTVMPRVVRGELISSLEEAVRAGAAEPELAYEMADVLQWDLDFARDLRRGDRFEVLYEEVLMDGEYHDQGNIIAVRYFNRGKVIEAYRYEDSYYDGEGRPLKKMFLRAPLRFTRVTSPFSRARFHPVLHVNRPHWGVDYGAPVGTPVLATANGTVVSAGWDSGGGGRVVKVRHPNGYITCYLHLSRFADGLRPGRTVSQGEVIAYVGASGLATGPHLDYRVSLNGQWIDPQSISGVPARPIAGSQLAAFRTYRDELRGSLESGQPRLPADKQLRLATAPNTDPSADTRIGRR